MPITSRENHSVKWKMGIPELIIIVSLIIALATSMNMKASSKDVARIEGRVSTLEGQFQVIIDNQAELKALLSKIDERQRENRDRLSRIEEAHKRP